MANPNRNTAIWQTSMVAAVPLAIALLGGNVPYTDESRLGAQVRISSAAKLEPVNAASLTGRQRDWLEAHNPFGLPQAQLRGHRTLIVREGYSLSHNNIDLIADWVAYRLTGDFVDGKENRPGTNYFKADPELPAGRRAERADYEKWNGVFDRGHQVANNDSRGRGIAVVRESFLLSNMTPQRGSLNRGKWKSVEDQIQKFAKARGELWVVTGPIFRDDDNDGFVEILVIGPNQVSVPTHYYKIVLARNVDDDTRYDAWAFLIPNRKLDDELTDYLESIDTIETLSGYDFFPDMADEEEDEMEARIAAKLWW